MGGRERGERGGLGQLEEAAAAVTDFNIPTSFLSLSLTCAAARRRLLLTWGNK